ncbi:flagellar hook assembly protein FlgD [Jeotgalibacillus soli]|uniref:Basal-body rod modification protein FlgD n=1 Tax=Jeotgalibacillus soli TaxID=889306 RepID=A0A0C2R3Q2_9BACL|nr:flagellar hook assembly protein FlgD [Jeotgalibacillus soli]KIL44890.1 hypothetical protein KP78_24340 [Jeotgalibacillus soli]
MEVKSMKEDLFLSSLQKKALQPKNNTMDKDAFLKLLVAQLSNQDPTNPMEDKEFVAQMASFSTLEQMTNMSESFERFASMQEQTQLIQYNNFVGKEIKWDKFEEPEEGGDPKAVSGEGIVETIRFKGQSVEFVLTDGTVLTPGNVSEVHTEKKGDSFQEASQLIGKKVSWKDDKDQELESLVTSVSRKDGVVWLHTENEKRINLEELIKIGL